MLITQEAAVLLSANLTIAEYNKLFRDYSTSEFGTVTLETVEPFEFSVDAKGNFSCDSEVFPEVNNRVYSVSLITSAGLEVPLEFRDGEYVATEIPATTSGILTFRLRDRDLDCDPGGLYFSSKVAWILSDIYPELYRRCVPYLGYDPMSEGEVDCSIEDDFLCNLEGNKLPPIEGKYFLRVDTYLRDYYFKLVSDGYKRVHPDLLDYFAKATLFSVTPTVPIAKEPEWSSKSANLSRSVQITDDLFSVLLQRIDYSELCSYVKRECSDHEGGFLEFAEKERNCDYTHINVLTGVISSRVTCLSRPSANYMDIKLWDNCMREYPVSFNSKGEPFIADRDLLKSLKPAHGDSASFRGTVSYGHTRHRVYIIPANAPLSWIPLLYPPKVVVRVFQDSIDYKLDLLCKDVELTVVEGRIVSPAEYAASELLMARRGVGAFIIREGECIFPSKIEGRINLVVDLYKIERTI